MNQVQIMSDKFSTWLNRELKIRGWSHRQLGQKAGLTGAAISAVISGVRKPGWDLVAAIAGVMGRPPLELFRLAGLLPEEAQGEDEPALLHHYRRLSLPNQRAALDMLRGLARDPALPCPPQLNEVRVVYSPRAQTAAPGLDDILATLRQLEPADLKDISDYARFKLAQHEPAEPAAASGDPDAAGEPVEMINLAGKDYPAEEIRKAVEAIVEQLTLDDWLALSGEIAENMRQEVQDAGRGQPEPEQPAKTTLASSGKKPST